MVDMPEGTVLSQYTPGFKANLNLAPQQTDSKLLFAVEHDLNHEAHGTHFNADDVDPTDPEETSERVPDTPDKFPTYKRRVGWFRNFHDSAWLDTVDKLNNITDPTSAVMAGLMAGRWRFADTRIITDALGVAYESSGEDEPPTAVPFDADQVIAANYVDRAHQEETVPNDSSDFGLSIGKLLGAKLRLDDSEIEGQRFCTLSPSGEADLLERTPVTSRYYANVQALVEGKVDTLLGFTMIRIPRKRLLLKAGTTDIRRLAAWVKPALVYKARPVVNARVAIRHDKSDTPQAFYKTQHAASRRYDKGVVEIQCKEVD